MIIKGVCGGCVWLCMCVCVCVYRGEKAEWLLCQEIC